MENVRKSSFISVSSAKAWSVKKGLRVRFKTHIGPSGLEAYDGHLIGSWN